ncbi:MAG: patatin-like phospholipase family protein [Bacteroidetes bacterium]|nr:patatin-like phospholipase family protein [Bacteroidota bacterium]
MKKKYFVLSGGGCRGFAHLGAVKALEESGIYPSGISGTSSGAIAGAFLANGFSPDEIKEIFLEKLKLNMLSRNEFKLGLISMKNIRIFLQKNLRYKKFEDLPIPFYATSTSFADGSQHIFNRGNIIDAIIASCSIPVLFPPVLIHGRPFVDGGLSNNLPIEPFGDNKKNIVCIHVNPIKSFKPGESVFNVMDRAMHLSFREKVNRSADGCFLFIEPKELDRYGLFDIDKIREIFDVGYGFTKKLLKHP